MLSSAVRILAASWPADAEASDELDRALSFLGRPVEPTDVVAAGYAAAVATVVVSTPALVLALPSNRTVGLLVGLAAALGVAHAVHRAPVLAAFARRRHALGDAPDLVGRVVLRMHVTPTVETAAAFAAETGRGPLAESLASHLRRARGDPRVGLDDFASEWAAWFPSLRRATGLLAAAGAAPAGERARTLDRALSVVLDGAHDRLRTFTNDVAPVVTVVYAFGVLVPLSLVAVLPAARGAGLPVGIATLAVVYDLLVPLGLCGASGWLLLRRPVAFAPPRVSRAHPDVPVGRWRGVLAGIVVGALAVVVAHATLPRWTAPLAGLGWGLGAGLVVHTRPVVAVHDHVRAVEAGLGDVLSLVGGQVAEGVAVERAVASAGRECATPVGAAFEEAVRVQRRLRVGLHEALLGPYGSLRTVPSPRVQSVAALLALAAREGKPTGRALIAMADHLDDIGRVEREARADLSHVTGTIQSTASTFGPLVAGATVAMADGMRAGIPANRSPVAAAATPAPIATPDLGLAVGVYVVLLAMILSTLAVGLEYGLDRARVGHRVGTTLCLGSATYLAAVRFAGLLV